MICITNAFMVFNSAFDVSEVGRDSVNLRSTGLTSAVDFAGDLRELLCRLHRKEPWWVVGEQRHGRDFEEEGEGEEIFVAMKDSS